MVEDPITQTIMESFHFVQKVYLPLIGILSFVQKVYLPLIWILSFVQKVYLPLIGILID